MYKGFRYPAAIINPVVWLYFRVSLSFRDIKELMASRGIFVTYETIRQRERQMRRFKSPGHVQRFLSATQYRCVRHLACSRWNEVAGVAKIQ